LLSSFDVIHGFYDKTSAIISVVPGRLSRTLMIEHVCIGHEAVSLYALDLDAEDTRRDHHADFRVLLKGELSEFRYFSANQVVICFNIDDFLFDLIQERTSLQPLLFFFSEENREIGVRLRKNVDVYVPF
jgi:hypothetical protein